MASSGKIIHSLLVGTLLFFSFKTTAQLDSSSIFISEVKLPDAPLELFWNNYAYVEIQNGSNTHASLQGYFLATSLSDDTLRLSKKFSRIRKKGIRMYRISFHRKRFFRLKVNERSDGFFYLLQKKDNEVSVLDSMYVNSLDKTQSVGRLGEKKESSAELLHAATPKRKNIYIPKNDVVSVKTKSLELLGSLTNITNSTFENTGFWPGFNFNYAVQKNFKKYTTFFGLTKPLTLFKIHHYGYEKKGFRINETERTETIRGVFTRQIKGKHTYDALVFGSGHGMYLKSNLSFLYRLNLGIIFNEKETFTDKRTFVENDTGNTFEEDFGETTILIQDLDARISLSFFVRYEPIKHVQVVAGFSRDVFLGRENNSFINHSIKIGTVLSFHNSRRKTYRVPILK